jgi:hypothetical protein
VELAELVLMVEMPELALGHTDKAVLVETVEQVETVEMYLLQLP